MQSTHPSGELPSVACWPRFAIPRMAIYYENDPDTSNDAMCRFARDKQKPSITLTARMTFTYGAFRRFCGGDGRNHRHSRRPMNRVAQAPRTKNQALRSKD